MKHHSKQMH